MCNLQTLCVKSRPNTKLDVSFHYSELVLNKIPA